MPKSKFLDACCTGKIAKDREQRDSGEFIMLLINSMMNEEKAYKGTETVIYDIFFGGYVEEESGKFKADAVYNNTNAYNTNAHIDIIFTSMLQLPLPEAETIPLEVLLQPKLFVRAPKVLVMLKINL